MALARRDDTVTNTLGNAIAGAKVYYLSQPADPSSLTPLASVYSDITGTPASNPQITDGFGHAVAYLPDLVLYTIVYVYPNGLKITYPDQSVGGSGSSGGITPFEGVPSGTIDGTNRDFTIPKILSQATVWLNFPLIPNLGYTIAQQGTGMKITYATAPQPASGSFTADALYVQGYANASGGGSAGFIEEQPDGDIDGVNQVFTLSYPPATLWLSVSGTDMTPTVDYNLSGNTITFTFAPTQGPINAIYALGL